VVTSSWPRHAPAGLTDEVHATERVYELVQKGVPFREAYRRICEE
jgi:argininosuccinate lyase